MNRAGWKACAPVVLPNCDRHPCRGQAVGDRHSRQRSIIRGARSGLASTGIFRGAGWSIRWALAPPPAKNPRIRPATCRTPRSRRGTVPYRQHGGGTQRCIGRPLPCVKDSGSPVSRSLSALAREVVSPNCPRRGKPCDVRLRVQISGRYASNNVAGTPTTY
jgi:hypothetical protein